MAIEFAQTIEGPQKLQFSKDQESKFTEEEKAGMQELRDKGYLTSKQSEMDIKKYSGPETYIGEDGKEYLTPGIKQDEEVVDDPQIIKTKDGKFSIDIMGALSNVGDAAGSALSSIGDSASQFVQGVGSNLSAIAEAVPNKIEEIASDPVKKKNFMRGLEIINASSGIKPIGQAKSTFGAISEGLLKAEKGFIATDLAKLKAINSKKSASYMSGKEKALSDTYKSYADAFEAARKNYASIDTRFNEVYKLAKKGIEPPTGIISATFAPLEKVINELGLSDKADSLLESIGKNKEKGLTREQSIAFKEIFGAATKRQIVGQVKELYPVSNKDIEILLQTVGDISTSPQALRALVAAEKAAKEINENAFGKSYDLAFADGGNSNFRADSQDAAAKELAAKYKDEVRPETLIALYGKSDNPTAFQIVNAKYHQDLEPVYKDQEATGFFEVFKEKKLIDDKNIIDIIEKRQAEDGKKDLPDIPE